MPQPYPVVHEKHIPVHIDRPVPVAVHHDFGHHNLGHHDLGHHGYGHGHYDSYTSVSGLGHGYSYHH